MRILLRQPGWLAGFAVWERRGTSDLAVVECRRSLDRYRIRGELGAGEVLEAMERLAGLLEGVEVIELTAPVLRRASEALPVELGTLDAIHLASALSWLAGETRAPQFATHDVALARCARLMGLVVVGA